MRCIAVSLALGCIAMVALPQSPPARGDAPEAVAVASLENSAKAPADAVHGISQALYDGAASSGRFDMRGGGPLAVQPALTNDITLSALDAAKGANASEVIVGDLVKFASGNIAYKLTLFRVQPVQVIRSQFFTQSFAPNDYRSLTSKFSTDIAALSAPRSGTGTIYSLVGGVHADLGLVEGFHLGQRFNVLRNGQKTAEAEIAQISDGDALVSIGNITNGYQPAVGDRLVSQDPVSQSVAGAGSGTASGGSGFTVIGIILGAAAAILGLSSHGTAPAQLCGTGCSPAPSTTPGAFTVGCVHDGLNPPNFTCNFSKPVQGASTFNFGDLTTISVTIFISGIQQGPAQTLSQFAGGTALFDVTGTVLTFRSANSLSPGVTTVDIAFSNAILATDSTALTPFTYQPTFSVARRTLSVPAGPRIPIH